MEFDISENQLKELPKEIVNLTNLYYFRSYNPDLTLPKEQEKWIKELEEDGCEVEF